MTEQRMIPQMLSPREVADALGIDVRTVKNIPPEDLPFYRFGTRGDRKYDRTDVEAFIRQRRVTHS